MSQPRVFRQSRFLPPPGSAELVLVRHGESEPLVEGTAFPLAGGHGDPALAPEGRAQAEQVGACLADEAIDAIYVTTLRRTVETAAPLADGSDSSRGSRPICGRCTWVTGRASSSGRRWPTAIRSRFGWPGSNAGRDPGRRIGG